MSVVIITFALIAPMLLHATTPMAIAQGGRGATSTGPTACSLFTPQEISGITGARIRDGEPQAVPSGTECRFRSSDGGWLHVALGPEDAKTFAQVRGLLGVQAEMQAGVGDEAYFWGNQRIHVRVGTQTLTLGFARNDGGNATTKAQVLALAKLGAPRLR
jgi:hypothetical protein